MRGLDELMAKKKSFVTRTEASQIAIADGVDEVAAPLFLSFLSEMGVLLWIDETGLRDVVILDPVTYFVEPASRIICNHRAHFSDSTIHHKNIQAVCRKNQGMECDRMIQKGLVSRQLLNVLLSHKLEPGNIPAVIDLMLKYGLIIRLEQTQGGPTQVCRSTDQQYFLVPSLLPTAVGDPDTFNDDEGNVVKNFKSCYFVFSISTDLSSLQSIPPLQLRKSDGKIDW